MKAVKLMKNLEGNPTVQYKAHFVKYKQIVPIYSYILIGITDRRKHPQLQDYH